MALVGIEFCFSSRHESVGKSVGIEFCFSVRQESVGTTVQVGFSNLVEIPVWFD